MKRLFLALVLFPALALAGGNDRSVIQRPIEEFVAAQGTYCIGGDPLHCTMFEPPVGNLLGFIEIRDGIRYFGKADYAGLADRWAGGIFGTTFEGSITERPLPDGRAEVHVNLHTRNALAWVTGRYPNPNGGWLALFHIFGHTAPQVLAGDMPAFGDIHFVLDYIAPSVGEPIPDITRFFFDPTYKGVRTMESIHVRAAGTMDDGRPADLVLQMTGLLEVYTHVLDVHDGVAPTTQGYGIWDDEGFVGPGVELHLIGR